MAIDLKKKSDSESATYIRTKRTRVFKMQQEEFAEKFSVQLGTLRNWEQGLSEPHSYFLKLISLEEELMLSDKSLFERTSHVCTIIDDLMKDGSVVDDSTTSACKEYATHDVLSLTQLVLLQNIDTKLSQLISLLAKN